MIVDLLKNCEGEKTIFKSYKKSKYYNFQRHSSRFSNGFENSFFSYGSYNCGSSRFRMSLTDLQMVDSFPFTYSCVPFYRTTIHVQMRCWWSRAPQVYLRFSGHVHDYWRFSRVVLMACFHFRNCEAEKFSALTENNSKGQNGNRKHEEERLWRRFSKYDDYG